MDGKTHFSIARQGANVLSNEQPFHFAGDGGVGNTGHATCQHNHKQSEAEGNYMESGHAYWTSCRFRHLDIFNGRLIKGIDGKLVGSWLDLQRCDRYLNLKFFATGSHV